jgi:hypothetical protein
MIWLALLSAFCFIAITHDTTLPERFILDEQVILNRMMTVTRFEAFGDSFDNLAWAFRALGLGTLAISLIGYFASTLGLMFALGRSKVDNLSYIEFVVVCFWLFAQTVYIGMLSKEIVISIVVLILLIFKDSRFIIVIFTACATLVAVYFRSYWAITLPPTLLLYFGPRYLRKPFPLIMIAAVLFACLALNFRVQYGESLDFARQMANEWRDPSEVGSIIVSLIPGANPVTDVANAMLILGTFLLPVPLLLSGVATQMLGGICAFFTLSKTFTRYHRNGGLVEPGRFEKLCFCFAVSFLATQAIFEPDYGSFLRHLSPISPLLIYLMLSTRSVQARASAPDVDGIQPGATPVRFQFGRLERKWIKSHEHQ